jgi:hypothetical protein
MATNPVPGSIERKGTFKVEFLKDIEKRMQARSVVLTTDTQRVGVRLGKCITKMQ